jgi:hypothetical protein
MQEYQARLREGINGTKARIGDNWAGVPLKRVIGRTE